MTLKNKETKGQNILNLNLALKVCKIKADLLKLHTHFKKRPWSHRWFPKHYTDGIDLTFELIGKFKKNHNGTVRIISGIRPFVVVEISNHVIGFNCEYKEVSEKLALAMLQCIEDERNARKD